MKHFAAPSFVCAWMLLASACATAPVRQEAAASPYTVWDETLGEYHIHVESPEGFPQLTGVRRIKGNGFSAVITRGGVEVETVAGDCLSADIELDFSHLTRGELEVVEYCSDGERQMPLTRTRIHLQGDEAERNRVLILAGAPYDAEQCRALTKKAVDCATEYMAKVIAPESPDLAAREGTMNDFWDSVFALRDMAPGNPPAIQAAMRRVQEACGSICAISEVFNEPYEVDQIAELVAAKQVETVADCIASSASWQRVLRRHAELKRADCKPAWVVEEEGIDTVVAVGEDITDSPECTHFHRWATLKVDPAHRVWRREADVQGHERWVVDE